MPSSLCHRFKSRPFALGALFCRKSAALFGSIRIHIAAAAVMILYAGFQVLASAALSGGVSRYVFPVYRNTVATLLLAPFAFFLERERRRHLTLFKLSQFLVCGLVGVCINQTLYLAALYYTSAAFAATVQNMVPVLTFGMSACLGIEKVHVTRREGQAKVLGIIICMGGAILISLYRGPSVISADDMTSILLVSRDPLDTSSFRSWKLGTLYLLGNCITWAVWFILQTPVLKDYPAQLSVTVFTYGSGALQLAVIALCVERNFSTWTSTFYTDIPAVLYGGLVASGIAMTLQGWCASKGGPVLIATYQPLQAVIVTLLSSLFFNQTFYLGSLLGGFLIMVGLYFVVWGKSRESRLEAMISDDTNVALESDSTFLYSVDVQEALEEPLLCSENVADAHNHCNTLVS